MRGIQKSHRQNPAELQLCGVLCISCMFVWNTPSLARAHHSRDEVPASELAGTERAQASLHPGFLGEFAPHGDKPRETFKL